MRLLLPLLLASCVDLPQRPMADAGSQPPHDAGEPEDAGIDAGTTNDSGVTDGGPPDAGCMTGRDDDRDQLDDGVEACLAAAFLPRLVAHPNEGCALGALIYRARPHALDPTLVQFTFVQLYERDCGITGHIGDNEAFGVTISPTRGLVAMKAVAHQATVCQRSSSCGRCAGQTPCDVDDAGVPRLFSSQGKHGRYTSLAACALSCLDTCAIGPTVTPPLINVGEPSAHFTEDLTAAGVITTDAGWKESRLFHFNPWGTPNFGNAGNVADDLVDPAFDTPACQQ